jgi:hypothetical protein
MMTLRYLHAQPGATVLLACKIWRLEKHSLDTHSAIECDILSRSLPDLIGSGHFFTDFVVRYCYGLAFTSRWTRCDAEHSPRGDLAWRMLVKIQRLHSPFLSGRTDPLNQNRYTSRRGSVLPPQQQYYQITIKHT